MVCSKCQFCENEAKDISVYSWILCFIIPTHHCARILGVFPAVAKSHYGFHETLIKTLLNAGHHVTIIAPFKSQNPHENFTEISSMVKGRDDDPFSQIASPEISWFSHCVTFVFNITEGDCQCIMSMEEVKAIESFDVMILELGPFWKCFLPLAKKHEAPVIGTTPFHFFFSADPAVGNSRLPSVSPVEGRYIDPKMNFYARLQNFFYETENQVILYLLKRREKELFEQLFHSQDLETPISLLFVNNHASVMPRVLVPNTISIGGIQVKSAKLNPLPEYLQTFLDEAHQGVILFSLGTIAPEAALNQNSKTALIQTFKKIPQRVIWKFNGQINGLSNNVLLTKWLPQKEILGTSYLSNLAHKNTVAFISHCGINSLYEAIYYNKPMILMPIFGDQYLNAALLSSLKGGVFLNIQELSEKKLSAALDEIINCTRFRERMGELSQNFRDDPVPPTELVVYWTEYVIRHKGASHLRFTGADMSAYQYFLIDVAIFIVISSLSILFLAKFLVKIVMVKLIELGTYFRILKCESKKHK